MKRVDWRAAALLAIFAAAWWLFTSARGCDGGRLRPTEPVPTEDATP
jgi:hypothetical protein